MSETAISDPQPTAPPRRRWRRWVIGAVVAGLAAMVGSYVYLDYARERSLDAAIAEADRLDPAWRFEDLEAARANVPAAEDGAPLVLAAAAKIPGTWPAAPPGGGRGIDQVLDDVVLPARPDDADVKQLRAELTTVEQLGALAPARDLADKPRGRYAVAWSRDLVSTMMSHVQQVREVNRMLTLDALLRALDGDMDGALRSCRAALNAARSLGDEPALISQFVRVACARRAAWATERVLATGEGSPKSLEELQRAFAEEAEAPCQLTGARADRVMTFEALAAFRSGKVSRANFGMRSTVLGPSGDRLIDGAKARACQADYLRYDNQLVELAKLPAEEQQARLGQLKRPSTRLPALLEALSRGDEEPEFVRVFHRAKADLRCAAAALAAERYRLAKGRWPERLDDLVPDYLPAVPTDPFDGQPLRLRRTDDGLMIYSIGPDGTDNGGNLDRKSEVMPGTDVGFRLWDAGRRGGAKRQ
jgi:hypothetical protein